MLEYFIVRVGVCVLERVLYVRRVCVYVCPHSQAVVANRAICELECVSDQPTDT